MADDPNKDKKDAGANQRVRRIVRHGATILVRGPAVVPAEQAEPTNSGSPADTKSEASKDDSASPSGSGEVASASARFSNPNPWLRPKRAGGKKPRAFERRSEGGPKSRVRSEAQQRTGAERRMRTHPLPRREPNVVQQPSGVDAAVSRVSRTQNEGKSAPEATSEKRAVAEPVTDALIAAPPAR